MSTISFNVVAHDLASRVFDKVGRSALAMAAKIKAADGATTRSGQSASDGAAGWQRFNAAMDQAGVAAQRFKEKAGFLTGDNMSPHARLWFRVITLGAMLMTPALGAATVALGAIAGAAVAVVPGLGALGAAMVGVWKRIKEGHPALREATRALDEMKRAWREFITATQGRVGNVFTEAFKGMSDLLPRLVPMVNRFANVLTRFLRDVRRDMDSPAFDRALNWLTRVGSITFKNILEGGRNLVQFVYQLARAFQEAGIDVKMKWFKDLTQGMEDWAKSLRGNKDFKAFIDYFKQQWPTIQRIFKNLWETLQNMAKGLAPVGEDLLKVFADLTEALSKVKPETWEAIGRAFIYLSIAIKTLGPALTALQGIGLLIRFLTLVSGLGSVGATLMSIGRGLLGLGAGISRVIPFVGWFTALAIAIDKLGFAVNGFGGGKGVSGRMPPILEWVLKLADGKLVNPKTITISIMIAGMAALRTAKTAMEALKNKAISIAFNVRSGALSVATAAYKALRNKVVSITLRAAAAAWVAARAIYNYLKPKVVAITSAARTAAWIALRAIYNYIKPKVVTITSAAGRVAWESLRTLYNYIKPKVVTITSAAARAAWEGLKKLYDSIKRKTVTITTSAVLGAWQSAKSLYDSLVSKTVTITVDVIGDAIGNLLGRAHGGPVMAGVPYMVGEVGPELFVPSQSGRIVSNHSLPSKESSGSNDDVVRALLASQAALLEELASIRESLEGLPRRYQQMQRQGRR